MSYQADDALNDIPDMPGETLAIWGTFPGARLHRGPAWLENEPVGPDRERLPSGYQDVGYIEAKVELADGDTANLAVEIDDDDTYSLHIDCGSEVALWLLNELVELTDTAS